MSPIAFYIADHARIFNIGLIVLVFVGFLYVVLTPNE